MLIYVHSVSLRNVTRVQMCPLYTSHCFLESMYLDKRILFLSVSLFIITTTVCGMFIAPIFSQYFYDALSYMMFILCPLLKADTGTKLVNVWSWSLIVEFFVLLTWKIKKWEGFYFLVSFYAAHCSNHRLYFPIVSTEYGVHIKIL